MRGLLTSAAILMVCGSGSAFAAAPDLSSCDRYKLGDPGENPHRIRMRPLPVPSAVDGLVRSDMDHLAVSTLAGGTVCVDTRWMESTDDQFTLSPDGRYLSFTWEGYEAYGHELVDRSGKGQSTETGAKPVFSPSGSRLAAVSLSDASYGALEGLTVWQAGVEGLAQIARLTEIPYASVWRIDGWRGEDCIELSAVNPDHEDPGPREIESSPRNRYAARASDGWKPAPAPSGCAAP